MRLPNLLGTRNGRLAAFFLLYVTEGIPLGFAATAVATQLRRQGIGPAEIGAFVASFYLPWAFKWAFGPFVDVFRSQRFGHRRAWIIVTQIVMAATILALIAVPLPAGLGIFTAILLVHNTFGAIQDVAIDSLAVNTLGEDERGLANGLMFAGASVGQAVGGSGVLFLIGYMGFQSSFIFVAAAITAVTGFVVLPMKETVVEALALPAGVTRWRAAATEMRMFAVQSFRSFMGTRGAFSGVFFSLLPAGAMSLGLALQSNLAVELGMDDDEVAMLNLWSSIISAAAMVFGGWLSDRWGRRRTLAFYLAGMSLPVIYLLWVLQSHGYVMPRAPGGAPMPELLLPLWIAVMAYAVFQGLMYGTRSAIMMDVTNPRVAATQFTAYMAMMNLAISIAATWQGVAVEAWGYPVTLLVDAITGPLCILLLPWMKRRSSGFTDAFAHVRARNTSAVLGVCCLLWLLYWPNHEMLGAGQPIMGTFFTLVFISSALFLLAGREVLAGEAGPWRRAALWAAPLLLAMHGRYHLDKLNAMPTLHSVAELLMYLVPLFGGLVLLGLSTRNWISTEPAEEDAPVAAASA
ncbi:MFS transporter [Caenimonas aquaedulcis]|uniref:MFS transporter n=1 Tax=Caenimonas aquaedulcis TaxID=2793270 RepID=A0A931H4E1_9BURK|nr:MFS transporter [Caenimonas aquaedulcis]MBG9388297.1 MFS transporter [Caenimonas aquaedulcis]